MTTHHAFLISSHPASCIKTNTFYANNLHKKYNTYLQPKRDDRTEDDPALHHTALLTGSAHTGLRGVTRRSATGRRQLSIAAGYLRPGDPGSRRGRPMSLAECASMTPSIALILSF